MVQAPVHMGTLSSSLALSLPALLPCILCASFLPLASTSVGKGFPL